MFQVNGLNWRISLVEPHSPMLRRSDNTITLGVTDNNYRTVYMNNRLSYDMFDKVLCHELCHVFSFSYGLHIPIEIEEMIADFLSTYGRDVIAVADNILKDILLVA